MQTLKTLTCPDCGSMTDGKSCRCGWTNFDLISSSLQKQKKIHRCKLCAAPVFKAGFCKNHFEMQDAKEQITRWKNFLKNANDVQKQAIKIMIIELKKTFKKYEEKTKCTIRVI